MGQDNKLVVVHDADGSLVGHLRVTAGDVVTGAGGGGSGETVALSCGVGVGGAADRESLRLQLDRAEALLRRVQCYAVVDPLGNPSSICLPNAARMLGIETDIDDYFTAQQRARG